MDIRKKGVGAIHELPLPPFSIDTRSISGRDLGFGGEIALSIAKHTTDDRLQLTLGLAAARSKK